jgi:selenocysteine-specific translation elongation factor
MSEVREANFIVGIFGESENQNNLIGQTLGSPGTRSDIQFYNRLDIKRNQVFCALTPIEHPEKIKPFLQTLAMTNIHILIIDLNYDLTAITGEILVGMDLYHQLYQTHTLVVITGINEKNEWKLANTVKKINLILNTSSLRGTETFIARSKEDLEILKDKISEFDDIVPITQDSSIKYSKILIDHVFPVKGIGTVILGIVNKGEIHAGQMLELTGNESVGKKVIIRSIQKHDRNFKEAFIGDRVGIALKGNISPSEINRDHILATQGILKPTKEFKAQVFLNKYYTPRGGKLIPGLGVQYYAIVDLKISPFKITEGKEISPGESGTMTMKFDKNIYSDGTPITGIITELNRFNNKSRIVGYYTQILN